MDGVIAFYILVSLVLAIWALMRSFSVESALRKRIEVLERLLKLQSETPRSVPAAEPEEHAEPPAPAVSLKTAQQYQPQPAPIVRQAAPPPSTPRAAAAPAKISSNDFLRWLTGGNVFVRIGILILFFGVAFLLKYASEHHALPPEARITAASALAILLLAVGWRLRLRMPAYALALQGGGVGMLYLTTFGAFRLYQLLAPGPAFLILCAIAVLSAILAVIQDSIWLAAMGALGGFLAPVLASTGNGSHVVLFSYYLVLNAGIFAIALHRSWRNLNVLGFVCTFGIATAWGVLRYTQELYATTEPFLVAFFLMYVGITLLYAVRQSVRLAHYADGALIFGVPLVAFGLQCGMVHAWHFGVAFSALALGLFYMTLAAAILRFWRTRLSILCEAFLALGVGFATLAIPFALDAYWTSASWALEGAGIAWVGIRQRRALPLFSGLVLQFAAGVAFAAQSAPPDNGMLPIINGQTLGVLIIAVAALFSAWYLQRRAADPATPPGHSYQPLSLLMLAWGCLWWLHGGLQEAARLTADDPAAHANALLTFATGSLCLFSFCARGLRWPALGLTALLQIPAMAAGLAAAATFNLHPMADWGWLAWLPAIAVSVVLLYHLEEHEKARQMIGFWHVAGLLISLAIITWESRWQLDSRMPQDPVWRIPVTGVLPAAILLVLATHARRWFSWPVAKHAAAYTLWAAGCIALFLWFWLMRTNLETDSRASGLTYIPFFNPCDLSQFMVLLAFGYWSVALRRAAAGPTALAPAGLLATARIMASLAVFAWINGMLIRGLCYWLPLGFDWGLLYHSQVVQMSLSVLWTVCALTLMVAAARRGWRKLWFSGALLMALEVIKLFAVDLASAGSIERIVSFIVVGGLLLLIGYFSPLPPAAGERSGREVGDADKGGRGAL